MKKHIIDWEDVASSYYEKALSLAILLVLFAFLVSPKFEVKPFKRIIKVTDEIVTLDFNHELAGKELTFTIKVLEVQPAEE